MDIDMNSILYMYFLIKMNSQTLERNVKGRNVRGRIVKGRKIIGRNVIRTK